MMMSIQNLVLFCQLVLKKNQILTSIKGRNSVTNLRKTKIFIGCFVETRNYSIISLAFIASSFTVTEENLVFETVQSGPYSSLECFLCSNKGTYFYILFTILMLILSMIMSIQNFVSVCLFVLKILKKKQQILTSMKGRYSVANLRKTTIYITNADLVNDYVYTKFGLNRSICF